MSNEQISIKLFALSETGSLRVEAGEKMWLFPYSHLLFTAFDQSTKTLTLSFTTHDVTLEGEGLEGIVGDFQRSRVETVRVSGRDMKEEVWVSRVSVVAVGNEAAKVL